MDAKLVDRSEAAIKQGSTPAYSVFTSAQAEWAHRDAVAEVGRLTPLVLLEIARSLQRLEALTTRQHQ